METGIAPEKNENSSTVFYNDALLATFACMIAIDNVLLSDEIIKAAFVCDLNKCKGACCVDGEAGAPLDKAELKMIDEVYNEVLPYLNDNSKRELKQQGRYVYHVEYGWVTPTINSQICVYGITDPKGIVKCGIEQAYLDGKTNWKKPISCHLFPVIVSESKDRTTVFANYEPREDHCKPACALGKKLQVPVYKFLKEPLIRRFGEQFYESLEATANHQQEK